MTQEEKIYSAARKHADSAQLRSDFPHDWSSEKSGFIYGALSKEAKEYHTKEMYSEEEVINILKEWDGGLNYDSDLNEWFEQNKKK